MKLQDKNIDYLDSTNVVVELVRLAIPSIFSRLSNIFVEVVITFFVAKLGVILLSAYGLATPFFLTIYLIMACFLMVFSVRACRLINQLEELSHYFYAAILLTLLLSLLAMTLLYLIPLLLPYLGQNLQIVKLVQHYFYILMWGVLPQIAIIPVNQLLLVLRRGRVVVVNSVAYMILALLLVYVLILGHWHLGLPGVAIALVCVNWLRLIVNIIYLLVKTNLLDHYSVPRMIVLGQHIKYLLLLGFPLSLQFGSELLSGTVAVLMIGHINAYAISIQQVANQARVFIVMIPFAIGQACAMLSSTRQKDNQLKTIGDFVYLLIRALIVGFVIMLPWLLWLIIAPDSFISLFFHTTMPAAMKKLAHWFLDLTLLALLFDLLKFSVAGLLRGIGNTRLSMVCSMIGYWLIGIPAAVMLAYGLDLGPIGVRVGMVSGLIISTLLMVVLFTRSSRLHASIERKDK